MCRSTNTQNFAFRSLQLEGPCLVETVSCVSVNSVSRSHYVERVMSENCMAMDDRSVQVCQSCLSLIRHGGKLSALHHSKHFLFKGGCLDAVMQKD